MKKRKYLAIIAAALLTISPVIATNFTDHSDVVKAASDEAAETITFTKVPTLNSRLMIINAFKPLPTGLRALKLAMAILKQQVM